MLTFVPIMRCWLRQMYSESVGVNIRMIPWWSLALALVWALALALPESLPMCSLLATLLSVLMPVSVVTMMMVPVVIWLHQMTRLRLHDRSIARDLR